MTIGEYLQNPYGRGSAFSPSSKQREDLETQLKEIFNQISTSIYRYRDFVIYHIVIPSTKKDNDGSYDVIIEVETKNLHAGDATLEHIPFKAFSNCPSFIFTYANAFRTRGMLCEWLLPKYSKEVRTKPSTQRNQYGIIGLERSLYLALRYIHITGKTSVGVYQTTGKKITNRNEIINTVRTQEQIMEKAKAKISIDKKTEIESKPKTVSHSSRKPSNPIKVTANVKTSKTTKTNKTTKTQKTIKSIKKV